MPRYLPRWLILAIALAVLTPGGCGRGSKVERIRQGMEDVDRHAQRINDAAAGSDKSDAEN